MNSMNFDFNNQNNMNMSNYNMNHINNQNTNFKVFKKKPMFKDIKFFFKNFDVCDILDIQEPRIL